MNIKVWTSLALFKGYGSRNHRHQHVDFLSNLIYDNLCTTI